MNESYKFKLVADRFSMTPFELNVTPLMLLTIPK